jgi:protein-tyrosine kinase
METNCRAIEVESGISGSTFLPASKSVTHEPTSSRGELSRDRWRTEAFLSIDQCRLLVDRLFLSPGGTRSVIFSGVTARSGCTSVIFSTAEAMAVSTSKTVCVIDANAYSPYLASLFDLSSTKGLSDALIEERPATDFAQQLDESNLWVIPYGRQPVLDTEKRGRCFWVKDQLTRIASQFDYVLVDTPSASQYSDAVTLGSAVGGAALVVKASQTRRDIAARTAMSLRRAGLNILGVVMTNQKAV